MPAAFTSAVLILASLGGLEPLAGRLVTLVSTGVGAGWTPAAYLLGAIGWGVLARPWTRDLAGADAINAGVGVGVTLSVTHALGVFGWLNPVSAWLWTGVGLVLLGLDIARRYRARQPDPGLGPSSRHRTVLLALASVGVAVMFVAAALPPGALWDSEFGGYDALSYHLQLPTEWLEIGRIVPLEHNVYSFLPGYFEAGVLHLAHLRGTPTVTPSGLTGTLSGMGDALLSAHYLALGLTLVGAWFAGALTRVLAERAGFDASTASAAAWAAGALLLLTPWTQVVGSLAYNEPGVVALGAAGLLAAATPGLGPVRRATLVALLIGVATGCKPTAVIFLAPTGAILMAMSAPRKAWALMFGVGVAVGLLTLAPWLARNAVYTGNPVFPHANNIFGHAHWTPEQSARYAAGHRFDGSVFRRIATLVAPAAEAGNPAVVRWRGLTNPQWALTPWLGLVGMAWLLTASRRRTVALALLGGTAGALIAWMALTHIQSRFLVPLLPLFVVGFGLGAASLPRPIRAIIIPLLLAVSAVWSMANYAGQRDGHPNALLILGPHVFTGQLPIGDLGDQVAWAGVNETAQAGDRVLLVGDATPMYLRRPVAYATTWDTHPLARVMRERPDRPETWAAALVADGHRWVLVSYSELQRLADAGWNDPALTPERVRPWCDTLGPPARVWPEQGRVLYRLRSDR